MLNSEWNQIEKENRLYDTFISEQRVERFSTLSAIVIGEFECPECKWKGGLYDILIFKPSSPAHCPKCQAICKEVQHG